MRASVNIERVKKEVSARLSSLDTARGEAMFNNCEFQIMSQSAVSIDFMVDNEDGGKAVEYTLFINYEADKISGFTPAKNNKPVEWDAETYAYLLQYEQELRFLDPKEKTEHKKYTRQGMINRVLNERRQRADKASYHIRWAKNIYGDHILTNEQGIRYVVFLRDFENEIGYSDSWDSKLNKLGTTKHIMYAFDQLKTKMYRQYRC